MKYDNEWFISRIKEKRPNDYHEYVFLEDYVDAKTYINALHKPCGEVVPILPNTFISRGSGCKDCSRKRGAKKQAKSHEDVIQSFPESIVPLTRYQSAFKNMIVYCKKCDKTYPTTARELIKSGCTRCAKTYKRDINDVKDEISDLTNGEYIVLSDDYKNAHTHIEVLHKKCGNPYPVTTHNFRRGKRCPYCKESKGEKLVSDVLESFNIPFITQVKFEDLKLQRQLSYDFFLKDSNILIEYQGEQHYKPVELFGGERQFKIQVKRDALKRKYASDNGITLLEIPYTCDTLQKVAEKLKPYIH